MRTRRFWVWFAVLLVGLSVAPSAWADDDDADDAPKTPPKQCSGHGIFNKMYDAIAGPPQPKPAPAKPGDKKTSKDPAGPKVTIIDANRLDRAQVDATYFRRLAVCDHLREIAAARNDPGLERQAEELSDKAWQIYNKQLTRCSSHSAPATAGAAKTAKPATVASADKNSPAPANGDVR